MMLEKNIKSYMEENGIKQSYVSAKTNIPDHVLSKILNGKRRMYAEELFDICKALGVKSSQFYKGE